MLKGILLEWQVKISIGAVSAIKIEIFGMTVNSYVIISKTLCLSYFFLFLRLQKNLRSNTNTLTSCSWYLIKILSYLVI